MENRCPSKAFMNRFFAYALTRLTYRDTDIIENNHVESLELSMDCYKKMLVVVQQNYERELPRMISVVYEDPKAEDDRNLSEWLSMFLKSMDSWDKPVKVRDKYRGSIAEFVLSGEFLTACLQRNKLTDEMMKILNIDVHNRYYTLVCRDIVDISAK